MDSHDASSVGAHSREPTRGRSVSKRLLKNFDRHNNGSVVADDFLMALRHSHLDLTTQEGEALIEHLDKDRDGVISFDEFEAVMQGNVSSADDARGE